MRIKTSNLIDALSAVRATVGASEDIHVRFRKGKMRVHVTHKNRSADYLFKADPPEKGDPPDVEASVAVNFESLRKAVNGRKSILFDHDDKSNVLICVAGKYSVKLPLLPYREAPSVPEGEPLPENTSRRIVKMFKTASVVDPFDFGEGVVVHLRGGDGGLRICSADINHAVLFEGTAKTPEFDVAVPAGYASVLSLAGGDGEMSLHIEGNLLYLSGDKLAASLPVYDHKLSYTDISTMITTAFEASDPIRVDGESLKRAVENMGAVEGDGAFIRLALYDDEIEISSSSRNGKAKDVIKAEGPGKGEANFDPVLLREIVSKFEGDVDLGLARNRAGDYGSCVMRAVYRTGGGDKEVKTIGTLTAVCATAKVGQATTADAKGRKSDK